MLLSVEQGFPELTNSEHSLIAKEAGDQSRPQVRSVPSIARERVDAVFCFIMISLPHAVPLGRGIVAIPERREHTSNSPTGLPTFRGCRPSMCIPPTYSRTATMLLLANCHSWR